MGNQGKSANDQSGKKPFFFKFRSEFNFREETLTVNRVTPFLTFLAFSR